MPSREEKLKGILEREGATMVGRVVTILSQGSPLQLQAPVPIPPWAVRSNALNS